MNTCNVFLNAIRAARTHTAEADTRYWLNGIYLDFRRGKIVGTDGHRLFVGDIPAQDVAPVILSNELVDAALKQFGKDYARGKDLALESVQVSTDGINVSIRTPIGTVEGKAIDGQYPDYTRVIPRATPAALEASGINGRYVYEAFEAIAIYRNKKAKDGNFGAILSTRGNESAVVSDGIGGCLCVVMPMRIDAQYHDTNNVLNGFFRSLDPLAQGMAAAA